MTSASHSPTLTRSLGASAVLHALGLAAAMWLGSPRDDHDKELVDIELAPPPPKAEALPAEVAKPPEAAQASHPSEPLPAPPEPKPDEGGAVDAGIDAPIDAPPDAPKKKQRPDAATEMVAEADAGVDAPEGDGGVEIAAVMPGSGAGSSEVGSGAGSSAGSGGVAAATEVGSGSGAPGMTTEPAVEGAPTTAGTAANLLAYFPPGAVVSALIRFDRLRGTEWAAQTERLLRPLPDYRGLFGDRDAKIADQLDTLVISSPKPRDAAATTLVVHTQLSRIEIERLLANPDTPVQWSAARGGMLGKRSGALIPNDKRVLLSPWKTWFLLAQPDDLGTLVAPAKGRAEALEARGKLPPWLDTIRTIEKESGDDKRGPALVVTLAGDGKRYPVPDVGLGVTSLPSPLRISLATELVGQGWLVRGNMSFATEADAAEVVAALEGARQRVVDSHVMSALLRREHLLDIVKGMSLSRTGARVSYATSLSIADARMLLAAAAVMLDQYFRRTP